PVAHALAIPCLTAAFLMGVALTLGHAPAADAEKMLAVLVSAETGTTLLGLFAVVAAVAELFWRMGAPAHARFYSVGAIVIVLGSLALVTPTGLSAPGRAAIVYAVAGAGVLAVNSRWRRKEATYLGVLLLITASLWGLWWAFGTVTPEWATALAVE